MTVSEKIISGIFFILLAPTMIILTPTGLSLSVVILAVLVYSVRFLLAIRHRCYDCGNIFKLGIADYHKLAKKEFKCPSCKKNRSWTKLERL